MDGYWTPKHSDQMKSAILADWCDQLEGWPADEVKDAMNEYREKNPDRRPNPGHILQVLKASRRAACGPQIEVMRRIADDVADESGLPEWLIRGPSQMANVCAVRADAMSRCREQGITLALIGEFFGNRDHTTVMHAIQRHQEGKVDK